MTIIVSELIFRWTCVTVGCVMMFAAPLRIIFWRSQVQRWSAIGYCWLLKVKLEWEEEEPEEEEEEEEEEDFGRGATLSTKSTRRTESAEGDVQTRLGLSLHPKTLTHFFFFLCVCEFLFKFWISLSWLISRICWWKFPGASLCWCPACCWSRWVRARVCLNT